MSARKLTAREIGKLFTHLGAQKLTARKFLKYNFRLEFDGILQYFSPP